MNDLTNDEATLQTIDVNNSCKICRNIVGKYAHEDELNGKSVLICHTCNMGLGAFKNNLSLLQNALDYLKTVTRIDKPASRRRKIKIGLPEKKVPGRGKGDSIKWHEERYRIEDDAKARYEKLGNLLGWDNVTARQVWNEWVIRYNSKGMID